MNWIQRNFKTIIYLAFLIPIITVAIVSISHVTKWYGITNPFSWAIYLSVGIEIAALSALAAIAAQMGRKVYFPFIIVTLIQFLGNIYFAYSFIDVTSKSFIDWVELVDPVVSFIGVESGDIIGHKRFLALFAGGMLPLISLTFLHMLVKFEEEDKKKEKLVIDIEKIEEPKEEDDSIVNEEKKEEENSTVNEEIDNPILNEELKEENVLTEELVVEESNKLPELPNQELVEEKKIESKDGRKVLSYVKRDA
jgi:hypothetical protein